MIVTRPLQNNVYKYSTNMNPYENQNMREFLESIPQEVIDEQTRLQNEENDRLYDEFTQALSQNMCSICNKGMDTFDIEEPCFHWFTYPTGMKKKYIEKYLKEPMSFFRLNSYFRWLANTENPLRNINDLKDETSSTSYLETTIKYKNIAWAFSIGHTDLQGHKGAKVGATPHYHLQMLVDERIFLQFNDCHIQFTDEDLFNFEMLEQAGDLIQMDYSFGHGIGIIEDERNLEIIDSNMVVADDWGTAPFSRQTMITAEEGQTISGELIQKAIEESKVTGETAGRIMQRLLSESESKAEVVAIISPGKGVPEMTKRSGKK